jgi:phosphatidate cytidylyltransferase
MLRQRVLVAAVLLPVGLWVVAIGGWPYAALVAVFLTLAAGEFALLFRRSGFRPSRPLVMLGAGGLALARQAWGFDRAMELLAGIALAAMAWHLVDYERGAERSGSDFCLSLGGIAYLGGVGAFLVSLRNLPDGLAWLLVCLAAVWIGDSAAYFIGTAWGRHKMAPRLSPNKSWEGYSSGIAAGGLAGAGLAGLFSRWPVAAPSLELRDGLVVGLALAALTPLGDLGISMIKRETQVKDSGNLLPGHGGALDRVDSWLWAGVLGYYLALLLSA